MPTKTEILCSPEAQIFEGYRIWQTTVKVTIGTRQSTRSTKRAASCPSSFRREDNSIGNDDTEEDKEDELDRDVDMDVDADESIPDIYVKPPFRKRLSLRKYEDDEEFERITNEDNVYRHPAEEDYLEPRKSDLMVKPKRSLKMKKLRSAVFTDTYTSNNL